MKIGFDCDGVLRNIDTAMLFMINHHPEIDKKWYFLNKRLNFNPSIFLHEDDIGYVISVQTPDTELLTTRWLEKHCPNLERYVIVLKYTEEDWERNADEIFMEMSKAKAININELELDVYIEDAPNVVRHLRDLSPNTRIIQYGGRLV